MTSPGRPPLANRQASLIARTRLTEGGWFSFDRSHGLTHLGLFLQAQTVAPVRGQGLLGHTPVP